MLKNILILIFILIVSIFISFNLTFTYSSNIEATKVPEITDEKYQRIQKKVLNGEGVTELELKYRDEKMKSHIQEALKTHQNTIENSIKNKKLNLNLDLKSYLKLSFIWFVTYVVLVLLNLLTTIKSKIIFILISGLMVFINWHLLFFYCALTTLFILFEFLRNKRNFNKNLSS